MPLLSDSHHQPHKTIKFNGTYPVVYGYHKLAMWLYDTTQ